MLWQQAFSKPCLVNLISKETHLVFSIPYIQRVNGTYQMLSTVAKILSISRLDLYTSLNKRVQFNSPNCRFKCKVEAI